MHTPLCPFTHSSIHPEDVRQLEGSQQVLAAARLTCLCLSWGSAQPRRDHGPSATAGQQVAEMLSGQGCEMLGTQEKGPRGRW